MQKVNETALIEEYIKVTNSFKIRRLIGLVVLSLLLIIPLGIIYTNGWANLTGTSSIGWLVVGVFVSVSSIGAVLIDLFWRK
ncbi:hypothetical protein [Neobacillus cucumis]|uniref:hypothetical protein n=1 Tax=Neobacillus cucumis TaxID=1740721 RepID=UPI002E1CB50B|nr:hypothetical protein [Neobacillus cucumis]